ncbi:MAG: hypothetical protein AAFV53_25255 [Myxococcota bacterium]
MTARVPVRPDILNSAREHVLRCLPEGVGEDEAERLATIYTRDYLNRLRDGRYQRPDIDPDIGMAIPESWRLRLFDMLDRFGRKVLQLHYGDGYPLEKVARFLNLNVRTLTIACDRVRASARALLGSDGVEMDGWSDKRLDRTIRRIANQVSTNCPGPVGLLSDVGQRHAQKCPRCHRAVRLIQWGAMSTDDLFPPKNPTLIPSTRVKLLAVLLHPSGRDHHGALVDALGADAMPTGPDSWLFPADDLSDVQDALTDLARQNTPPRYFLRGALVEGPGRWSQKPGRSKRGKVLLGPLPVRVLEAARARPWAEIDGIGELPPPLPPPPRATGLWVATAALAVGTALVGAWALNPPAVPPTCPIQADFIVRDAGIIARFDADELSVIDVVALEDAALQVVASQEREGKGRWATGEGDYQLHLPARRVALISSPEGIGELAPLMEQAKWSERPLEALVEQVRIRFPEADVVISPSPDIEQGWAAQTLRL